MRLAIPTRHPWILAAALLLAACLSIPSAHALVPGPAFTLQIDDGGEENWIGDNGQFVWMNRFSPATFPIRIDEVQVALSDDATAVGDGKRSRSMSPVTRASVWCACCRSTRACTGSPPSTSTGGSVATVQARFSQRATPTMPSTS